MVLARLVKRTDATPSTLHKGITTEALIYGGAGGGAVAERVHEVWSWKVPLKACAKSVSSHEAWGWKVLLKACANPCLF